MENKELALHAKNIRKNIVKEVYSAQSGHPGGSLGAADILTELYFEQMDINQENVNTLDRDRFVLSKGHASPALYAVLAEKGFLPEEELTTFRAINSKLQGHPNMNYVAGVDMSTGSLGQGISCAVGMALANKLDKNNHRIYTLLGDGECQEGQVWEATMSAAHYKLDNLCIVVDNNNLQIDGHVNEVMSVYPLDKKFEAFNCHVINVDGHNFDELRSAFEEAKTVKGQPTVIVAHTTKGKGVSFMEDQQGWHGVAPNEEQYHAAMKELGGRIMAKVATRVAYGDALKELLTENKNVVVLDADLAGSTKSGEAKKVDPSRHFDMGIAEGNMMSVAAGLAASGKVAYASTFAMFATGRGFEQIRNSIGYPHLNVKVCASHAGISVGEDGASHQCIEDISLMRGIPGMKVIVPCDYNEAKQACKAVAEIDGPCYVRLGRSGVESVNGDDYKFELGKGVVLKKGEKVALVATGLMVQEALEAAEKMEVSPSVVNIHTIKPIDKELIIELAKTHDRIVTCEEHSIIGGLGSAVAEVLAEEGLPCKLVRVGVLDVFGESGKPADLFAKYKIDANAILEAATK